MATTKELREERLNHETKISEFLDKVEAENRDMNTEENTQYEKMMADSLAMKNRIERLEKRDESLKSLNEKPEQHKGAGSNVDPETFGGQKQNKEQSFALATAGWFRNQCGMQNTEEEREAAEISGLNLHAKQLSIPLNRDHKNIKKQFQNALTSTGGTTGGSIVPEGFVTQLELAMLAFGPMLQVSEIMRTNTGAPMPWPTANDTGNSGRQIGETKAVAEVNPTFGANVWNAYKFTSDEILIAYELLEDGGVDLSSIIPAMLGERLGRILNTKATTGTGAGTMYGVAVQATTGKTAASTTAITFDEVLDLEYSVDPAYRAQGSYMANDAIILALRKLKDTTNQYLWQPSIQAGAPDRLNGRPIFSNTDMASSMTASANSLIFGDLSKYKIRQVNEVRIYRLEERYRENDEDAFLAFVRADGRILDAGTHPIKKLIQAAS